MKFRGLHPSSEVFSPGSTRANQLQLFRILKRRESRVFSRRKGTRLSAHPRSAHLFPAGGTPLHRPEQRMELR